jgi:hypothetical protein
MHTTERNSLGYNGLRLKLPANIGKDVKYESRDLGRKGTLTFLSAGYIDMNIDP